MIRRAIPADIPKLNELLFQVQQIHADGRPDIFKSGNKKYTTEKLESIIQNDDTPIYVYDDGAVKGYVFCILQETNETEFKMALGDTLVWKPFDNCDMNGYSISGPKVISFKAIGMGEQIQIIAKSVGKSSIIATCQNNDTEAVAKITVVDPNDVPVVAEKPVKPQTLPFTETYKFNPPKDNFFITIHDTGSGFNDI